MLYYPDRWRFGHVHWNIDLSYHLHDVSPGKTEILSLEDFKLVCELAIFEQSFIRNITDKRLLDFIATC